MYHLLSLDATPNSRFFVTQFLLELKDEIREAVRLQAPTSVTRAAILSRIQEEEVEASRPRYYVLGLSRSVSILPATVTTPTNRMVRSEQKRPAGDEFWCE